MSLDAAQAGEGEDQDAARERRLPELQAALYDHLRRIARKQMARERRSHTLQTTALVHEAFLRLAGQERLDFDDKSKLTIAAAAMMRRILTDHARARGAVKRGAGVTRVALSDELDTDGHSFDVIALGMALDRMRMLHGRETQVVELRFYAGQTIEETATLLCVSASQVNKDWRFARAWLGRELGS